MEESRCAFKILTYKPQERKLLEALGEDGKKILGWDLKETDINTRSWVDSAQGRDYWRVLVKAALNLRVP